MTEGQMNCLLHFAGAFGVGAFTERDRYDCWRSGWLGAAYDHRVMARITVITPWGVASLRQARSGEAATGAPKAPAQPAAASPPLAPGDE